MTHSVLILNGPNLNLLGAREPAIYGAASLHDIEKQCAHKAKKMNLTLSFKQSNGEAELIALIQSAIQDKTDAIIINAAALTHTSIGILDALKAFDGIVIEVHLSNIYTREEFRTKSYVSLRADGILCGLGVQGYLLALDAIHSMLHSHS